MIGKSFLNTIACATYERMQSYLPQRTSEALLSLLAR